MSDSATADAPAPLAQPDTTGEPLLEGRDLHKSFRMGSSTLDVLRGADFAVHPGEFVCILGQSGSGKSTLLHLLGLLDRPDAGEVRFDGHSVWQDGAAAADGIRNASLGFVFQFYHLLPELDVLENTLTPLMVAESVQRYHTRQAAAQERATELLTRFGLGERLRHRPSQLSGGERQRTAIARALINQPRVLLADEPTGNLDRRTGAGILSVLLDLNRQHGQTIVMVTHDESVARQGHRIVRLEDGRVVREA